MADLNQVPLGGQKTPEQIKFENTNKEAREFLKKYPEYEREATGAVILQYVNGIINGSGAKAGISAINDLGKLLEGAAAHCLQVGAQTGELKPQLIIDPTKVKSNGNGRMN